MRPAVQNQRSFPRMGACRCTVLLACIGVALALGVVAPSAAGPAPSFAPAKNYATGKEPKAIVIADFNGDRKLDIVTANARADTVSVLLNKGGGGFRARRDYLVAREPWSMASGDLNGDRRPDLAIANPESDTVSVLLNRQGGTFPAKVNYPTGGDPWFIAVGELNGDVKPDLVTANFSGGGTVSVLLNGGGGSFGPHVDYTTGTFTLPISVAIGDVNGDGKQDLAVANSGRLGSVSVLLNAGDGRFAGRRDYRTGYSPESVAIGDLNGDGKQDLATASRGAPRRLLGRAGTVSVFLNRG